jgi:glycosyltransferase involved in cell wall biosynthesis
MKISIMIPVYNEVARVERAIEAVHAIGLDAEIICVDDGSTDGHERFSRGYAIPEGFTRW